MPSFTFFKDVQSVGLESLAGQLWPLGLMFENRALRTHSFIIYWFVT